MINIGYFVSKYPYDCQLEQYSYGGSIVAAYQLSKELIKNNCNLSIFTTSYDSNDSIKKNNNATIYRFGTNYKLLSANIAINYLFKPLNYDVDIAHIHFDIPPGPIAGLRYANKKKVPLIVTYHGDWIDSYGGFVRRIGVGLNNKLIVDRLLSLADIIISPSKTYITESKSLNKYSEKIVVIPNGIDLKSFSTSYKKDECRRILGLPSDRRLILFFGNLSPYKGPDIILKAMPKIIKNHPDVELIFAGRGVMLDQLKKLSRKLCIHDKVHFLGFIEDSIKPLVYIASDIFVLPSVMSTESFGIVNLEAMACGIPIVASRIGGIPDVVKDNICGLLIEPNDPKALSQRIIQLLDDEKLQIELGKMGKTLVGSYSWDKIAKETVKLYLILLNSN